MALWAFVLGYLLSSLIQIYLTEDKMKKVMGEREGRGVLLGTLFGFISSSCSFAALATTRSLFQKGASFISSIAFLLASTNLVIELGIVISIFLDWQFVVGEYVGGILLILICWALVKIIKPTSLIQSVRDRFAKNEEEAEHKHHMSPSALEKVSMKYKMEWGMVWKDVTIGFTIAGIIAAFVPDSFFEALFVNSGKAQDSFSFIELLEHVVIGPVAAFCTFIGSMGNIPLAALLYGKGVSFAGVMAFIFSDLVVFPVLRINAKYYGWKMSLFILFLLFVALILTSLGLHYGLSIFDVLPEMPDKSVVDQQFFKADYSVVLNIVGLILSAVFIWKASKSKKMHHHAMAKKGKWFEKILKILAIASYIWLAVGLGLYVFL
ncbi:permease [bacterium]|nr:permease [bacterium]